MTRQIGPWFEQPSAVMLEGWLHGLETRVVALEARMRGDIQPADRIVPEGGTDDRGDGVPRSGPSVDLRVRTLEDRTQAIERRLSTLAEAVMLLIDQIGRGDDAGGAGASDHAPTIQGPRPAGSPDDTVSPAQRALALVEPLVIVPDQ